MSHQAWRMPATLTGNHTARHSQQHAHPGSPCSSKPDCPVANRMLECRIGALGNDCFLASPLYARGYHMYFFSCSILTFGAISPWVWPSFWLQIMLLVWHSLCPYGSKASCRITCWLFLHPLSVFHHKLV